MVFPGIVQDNTPDCVSNWGALKDHEDCTTIRFVAKVRGLLDLDWEDVGIPLASDATSQVRPVADRTKNTEIYIALPALHCSQITPV
jgi:hypothetical protein